jgi:hypothetical protein
MISMFCSIVHSGIVSSDWKNDTVAISVFQNIDFEMYYYTVSVDSVTRLGTFKM